jgi:hypothetical protein
MTMLSGNDSIDMENKRFNSIEQKALKLELGKGHSLQVGEMIIRRIAVDGTA